jgi:transposase
MEEGELIVSQRELHRMHVIGLTLEGRESVGTGAELLGLSTRQVKRLRKKMRERGAPGVLHGNRGRGPWNRTVGQAVKKVLQLAKGRYRGLNDTHLTEKLGEKEGMKLSRATVRRILRQGGITAARRHRPKRHYKRRERKAQEGALLLWDGSPHRWLGESGPKWTLVVAIDDATGALLYGVFAEQEDAQSYLSCLKQLLVERGVPLAIYMDQHGIFKRNDDHWTLQEELAGERIPTQVGVALKSLGIQPIFALSPQAKGRVERLFGTLQDRLVSELRLAGIRTRDKATAFVNGPFRSDFNRRFAKPPEHSQSAWRKLPRELDVERICSFQYQATVGNDNAVRLAGVVLDIPEGPNHKGYAKSRVEVRQLLDGRWRVYLKDELLLETNKPLLQVPLRTVRRKHRERFNTGDIIAEQLRGRFA